MSASLERGQGYAEVVKAPPPDPIVGAMGGALASIPGPTLAALSALLGAALGVLAALLLRRRRAAAGAGFDRHLLLLDQVTARLTSFESTLTIPHERGRLGELLLEQLLATWLPRAAFDTQVSLPGGVRVDAAVYLGDRVVPIDSKFPQEAFGTSADLQNGRRDAGRRALRRHVEAISEKYRQPGAGLAEFALLYVPSDALYLRWFASEGGLDELQRALRLGVVPVGPSGLYLYLRTVSHALLSVRLDASGASLADSVQQLRVDADRLTDDLRRTGLHLEHLLKSHDAVGGAWHRLSRAISRLEGAWQSPAAAQRTAVGSAKAPRRSSTTTGR